MRLTGATSPTAQRQSSASISFATGSRSRAKQVRRCRSGSRGRARDCSVPRSICASTQAPLCTRRRGRQHFRRRGQHPAHHRHSCASGSAPKNPSCIIWADKLARQMVRDHHFTLDEKKQKLELTDEGREMIRYSNPPVGERIRMPWTSCTSMSNEPCTPITASAGISTTWSADWTRIMTK